MSNFENLKLSKFEITTIELGSKRYSYIKQIEPLTLDDFTFSNSNSNADNFITKDHYTFTRDNKTFQASALMRLTVSLKPYLDTPETEELVTTFISKKRSYESIFEDFQLFQEVRNLKWEERIQNRLGKFQEKIKQAISYSNDCFISEIKRYMNSFSLEARKYYPQEAKDIIQEAGPILTEIIKLREKLNELENKLKPLHDKALNEVLIKENLPSDAIASLGTVNITFRNTPFSGGFNPLTVEETNDSEN